MFKNLLYFIENYFDYKSYYPCERISEDNNGKLGSCGGTEIYGRLTGIQYQ